MVDRTITLESAHRGYEYQDLVCAIRAIDWMLGSVASLNIDQKRFAGDRFDDLRIQWPDGRTECLQFKRREAQHELLSLETFTNDVRLCRLTDLVLSSAQEPLANLYRLVVTDAAPTDPRLTSSLIPVSEDDPGPFIPGARTQRFRFDCNILWPSGKPVVPGAKRTRGSDVWIGVRDSRISREQLVSFCDRFILETSAPGGSLDLHNPGPAEDILLRRLIEDVGVGSYPNQGRSPRDVGEQLLGAMRGARNRSLSLSSAELFQRTGLRRDYGAAAPVQPVIPSMEVKRRGPIAEIIAKIDSISLRGGRLVLVGAPGRGKSWACSQLADVLGKREYITLVHHCYWNDDDIERDQRVRAEVVFGSLIYQLSSYDSQRSGGQSPAFSVTPGKLTEMLSTACSVPNRRVAIFVDGLDHVSRVLGRTTKRTDPSVQLSEKLAECKLPVGCVMIIACQPGSHVTPLSRVGAVTIEVPSWTEREFRELAVCMGVVQAPNEEAPSEALPVSDSALINELVSHVTRRSAGNPLQATYFLRELQLRTPLMAVRSALMKIPDFGGALEDYYQRLTETAEDFLWLPQALAVMDFSVTRDELREIFPAQASQINHFLSILAPVLLEKFGSGGIRIYHESFARFLLAGLDLTGPIKPILEWLQDRGEFTDSRAFRNIVPLLARLGKDDAVAARAKVAYLRDAIGSGFGAQPILRNLEMVAASAGRSGDWKAVTKTLELARAAYTFERERIEVVAGHAAMLQFVLGKDIFEDRLIFEGRTVFPYRAGLLYCASLDEEGQAPWAQCLETYKRGLQVDNTSYLESDLSVELAYLLGSLRIRQPGPVDIARVAAWVTHLLKRSAEPLRGGLALHCRLCVRVLVRTLTLFEVASVIKKVEPRSARAEAMLAFAGTENVRARKNSPKRWARYAIATGLPAGNGLTLVQLGVVLHPGTSQLKSELIPLTLRIQTLDVARFHPEEFQRWLDLVVQGAISDEAILSTAEQATRRPGWYHCWLRYNIALARLFVLHYQGEQNVSRAATEALRILESDLSSSSEVPSNMLFSSIAEVRRSIAHGLTLVDDSDFPAALRILVRVSEGLEDVSIRSGHPLDSNAVRGLAREFCNPDRAEDCLRALEYRELPSEFYVEHAEGELLLAEIAKIGRNVPSARKHWDGAVDYLFAYGFRKDMTVFDLLSSAKKLVSRGVSGIGERLALLQTLAIRVINHDDGDETPYGVDLWWDLIGAADPWAASGLLCSSRLDSVPIVSPSHFERAARSIFRHHGAQADPIVAACLRILLDCGTDATDLSLLRRLTETPKVPYGLASALVARLEQSGLDERSPTSLKETDLTELNETSQALGFGSLSFELKPKVERAKDSDKELSFDIGKPSRHSVEEAIRRWKRGRSWDRAPQEDERIVLQLSEVLLLLASESNDDAVDCLYILADALDGGNAACVLSTAGRCFEQGESTALAVIAYVLAFTRSKGGSGWLNFGGEEESQWLLTAAKTDSSLAFNTLTEEVSRIFQTWQYQVPGTARALTHAFYLLSDAGIVSTTGTDIWDAACEIIHARLPRTGRQDDILNPYVPHIHPDGFQPEIVDQSFARTIAAFSLHPGRDKKRQALWAVVALFSIPELNAMEGVIRLLPHITDYSTLSWVLSILKEQVPRLDDKYRSGLADVLIPLMRHPGLVIRHLASELCAGYADLGPLLPILSFCDDFMMAESRAVMPGSRSDFLLRLFAAALVERAEDVLPNFLTYVGLRVERLLERADVIKLDLVQRRELRVHNAGFPEAVFAEEACVQRAVQDVSGEAYFSMLRVGAVSVDQFSWEKEMVAATLEDISWPVRLESTRVPFSSLPDEYLGSRRDPWIRLKDVKDQTIEQKDVLEMPSLGASGGPYAGWYTLGVLETREYSVEPTPGRKRYYSSLSWRTLALLPLSGGLRGRTFRTGNFDTWVGQYEDARRGSPLDYGTLTASSQGLGRLWGVFGYRSGVLLPEPSVIDFLELRASRTPPLSFRDDHGAALVLRTWRSSSSHEGSLFVPEFWGMDLLIRPDLLRRITIEYARRLRWVELTLNGSEDGKGA